MLPNATSNRYRRYLLVSSLLAGAATGVRAQDTTLIISSDSYAVFQKALDHRSALWHGLVTRQLLEGRDIDAVVAIQGTKEVHVRAVLNARERTLLRFWTHSYDSLLSEIALGRDAHNGYWHSRLKFCCYWTSDSLEMKLLSFMQEHQAEVLNDMSASSLSSSDKSFLALYLRSVLAYQDLQAFSTDTMLQETRRFLDEHAGSRQSFYVRKTLDQQYRPGGFGTGGYFFMGPSFFDGNMSKYFNNTWYIGGELSFSYSRAVLIAGFGRGLTRPIKAPFTYNEVDYTTETRTASGFGHALLGYAVLDNAHVRATPFLGFGGVGFSADDDNGNVTFPGRQIGLDLDWKFSHWQELVDYRTAFTNKFHQGYWAIRLRLGYERLFNSNDDATFGGSQIFVRLGISYFEGYGRRVKTWKHRPK